MSENGLMKNRMNKSLLHKLSAESILILKNSMKDKKLLLNNTRKKNSSNCFKICVILISIIITILYVYIAYS